MNKRFTRLTVLFFLALSLSLTTVCSAFELGKYSDGCLVPYAKYGTATDTVVGLRVVGWLDPIYWNFLSVDGVQLGHGAIPTTGSWLHSFSLRTADGNSHPDTEGYLVFTYDDNGTMDPGESIGNLTANALLFSMNDAAYIPVIPLFRNDYAPAAIDLNNLGPDSLVGLSQGFDGNAKVSTRYFIDPAVGGSTWLVVWEAGGNLGSFSPSAVTIGSSTTIVPTMERMHARLNVYNVSQDVTGMPANYLDGEISLKLGVNGGFVFSFIGSSAFSALQTFTAHVDYY